MEGAGEANKVNDKPKVMAEKAANMETAPLALTTFSRPGLGFSSSLFSKTHKASDEIAFCLL
jgi:hypothetical protein